MNIIAAGRIDRMSPEPYYLQLVRLLEADIDAGRYRVGDRLPGETEMCREFALARSTVRETLRSLQRRGRIEMVSRRGAFVLEKQSGGWKIGPITSFLQSKPGVRREDIATTVLKAQFEELTPSAASWLELEEGSLGFALRRVRSLNGKAAVVTDSVLPPEFGGMLSDTDVVRGTASLHGWLAEAGHAIVRTRSQMEALTAPDDVAELLQVDAAMPLLRVTALCWCAHDKPVHLYAAWMRTDVVDVTLQAHVWTQ